MSRFLVGCVLVAATAVPVAQQTASTFPARRDAKGIDQIRVPAGSFRMGTSQAALDALLTRNPPDWVRRAMPSEVPAHEVRLTAGFWIDTFEVTGGAFQAFIDGGGYTNRSLWSDAGWSWLSAHADHRACPEQRTPATLRLPCVSVTWFEADAYARWRGGRLPTEAEWEYAARGPQSHIYPWGDTFDPVRANVVGSTGLTAVGSLPGGRSPFGAHDMAGNAMEWVQDWLDTKYYEHAAPTDPTGPATGTIKVEKGGWWGSNEFVARSAYRHYEDPPDYADHHIGFRVRSPVVAGRSDR